MDLCISASRMTLLRAKALSCSAAKLREGAPRGSWWVRVHDARAHGFKPFKDTERHHFLQLTPACGKRCKDAGWVVSWTRASLCHELQPRNQRELPTSPA